MSIKVPAPKPLAPELFAPKKNWWGSTKFSTGHKQYLKTSQNTLKKAKKTYKNEIKKIRDNIANQSKDKFAQKRSGIIKANALRMESIDKQQKILTNARKAGTITPEKYDEKIAELLNYVSRQSVSTYRKRDIIAKYIPGIKRFRSYAKSDLYKKSQIASSTNTPENKLTRFQTLYNTQVANETQKSIEAQIKSIKNIQAFGNKYAEADYGSKSGMKTYKKSLALAKKNVKNSVYKAHKSYGLNTQNSKTIKTLKNAVIQRMQEQQALGTNETAKYRGANKWKRGWWNPLAYLSNKTYIKKSTDQAIINTKKKAQNINTLKTLSRDANIADTKAELLTKLHNKTSDAIREKARKNATVASTNAKTAFALRANILQNLTASLKQLPPPSNAPAQALAPLAQAQQQDATAAIIKQFGTNNESALRNLQIEQIALQQQLQNQNITEEERNALQKQIAEVDTKTNALNTLKQLLHQNSLQQPSLANPNASKLPPKLITTTGATSTEKQSAIDKLNEEYKKQIKDFDLQISNMTNSKAELNEYAFNSIVNSLKREKLAAEQAYNSALQAFKSGDMPITTLASNTTTKNASTSPSTLNLNQSKKAFANEQRQRVIEYNKQISNDIKASTFASNPHNNLEAQQELSDGNIKKITNNIQKTQTQINTTINTTQKAILAQKLNSLRAEQLNLVVSARRKQVAEQHANPQQQLLKQNASTQHTRNKDLSALQKDINNYTTSRQEHEDVIKKLQSQLYNATLFTNTNDIKNYILNLNNKILYNEKMIEFYDVNIKTANIKTEHINKPFDDATEENLKKLNEQIDNKLTVADNLFKKLNTLKLPKRPTLKDIRRFTNVAININKSVIDAARNKIKQITNDNAKYKADILKTHTTTSKQSEDNLTKNLNYQKSIINAGSAHIAFYDFKKTLYGKKLTEKNIIKLNLLKSIYDKKSANSLYLRPTYTRINNSTAQQLNQTQPADRIPRSVESAPKQITALRPGGPRYLRAE